MTVWAVLLVFAAAANPFRRRRCLSVPDGRQVIAGAAVAVAVYGALAVAGASLRDALDVSTPNMRVAAGLLLVVVGLHAVVAPLPAAPATIDARGGWLVPVLVPVMLRPDLALVAFAADRTSGVATVALSASVALAAVAAWWHVGTRTPAAERWLGAALGALTVVAAVRLLLDGVFAL